MENSGGYMVAKELSYQLLIAQFFSYHVNLPKAFFTAVSHSLLCFGVLHANEIL